MNIVDSHPEFIPDTSGIKSGMTKGAEPRSLKIGDTFFDEHLMILNLQEKQ